MQYYPPLNYRQEDYERYIQNKYEKSKLCWEANKIGFLVTIAMVVMTIVVTIFQVNEIYTIGYDVFYKLYSGKELSAQYLIFNCIGAIIGFWGCGAIFCKLTKTSLNDILPFNKIDKKSLTLFVFAGLGVCMVANIISGLIGMEFGLFGLKDTTNWSFGGNSPAENIIYIIAVAVEPALVEEFLFRGVVLGKMRKFGDGFAIIASAFLFGMMHGNITQIPFAFVVGLILGFVTVSTNSILPAVLIHFANNFYSVAIDITSKNLSENIANNIYYAITILIIILSIICIAILAKKYSNRLFNFNKGEYQALSFKEKISSYILNPGIIIFILFIAFTIVGSLSLG